MALHANQSERLHSQVTVYVKTRLKFGFFYTCFFFFSLFFSVWLKPGFSSLFRDGGLYAHPEHSHRPHQDPALLPQGPQPGSGTGVSCPQDLPRGEGQEARPLCLSNGVTQRCVLFSSLWSIHFTYANSVTKHKNNGDNVALASFSIMVL